MIFRKVTDDETLVSWGNSRGMSYDQDIIHCLIWNVYKGSREQVFSQELHNFLRDKDLALFQEVVTDQKMPDLLKQICPHWSFHMAQSFRTLRGHTTGVLIGGHSRVVRNSFLRFKEREFFFFTPKMTLFSEITWKGVSVLVVCTHVINFVTNAAFTKALYEIAEQIQKHQGPVLLAGDFNTWNAKRNIVMKQILGDVGMEQVSFAKDERFLQLDHVFVRGIIVQDAQILHESRGSDHYPLEVRLALD
jgi:endonuclease/exonuclease/phosphatase (EEP) superfamily protein YafD